MKRCRKCRRGKVRKIINGIPRWVTCPYCNGTQQIPEPGDKDSG